MRSSTSCKILAAVAATAVSFGLLTSSSAASEPEPPSCLGQSFSAIASTDAFSEGIVFFAQVGGPLNTQPGLGDGIQNIQAGLIPDSIVPNTCN
jgi:hypothetical protein